MKKLGRQKSIENLTLPHPVTIQHLDVFRRMTSDLNLKQLELSYNRHASGSMEFRGFQLINMFTNTLIALRLNFNHGCRNPPTVVTFANELPKLRILQLRLTWDVSVKCESFNNIFPALEKIDIDFDIEPYYRPGDHSRHNILISDEPCSIPTMKSSIIRCLPITIERLDRIITIFPTLKILKCRVTPGDGAQIITNIWTGLTQLEGLQIYGELAEAVNIDSLLTGISARKINMKKTEMMDFFKSLELLDIEVRRNKILVELNKYVSRNIDHPSIRNLTNLKSLELDLSPETGGRMNHWTDVAGYFALYALNSLQHLNVSDCKLSKSCAEILVNDKNLMSWKFRSTTYDDIIPGSWEHQITDNRNQDKFPLLNV